MNNIVIDAFVESAYFRDYVSYFDANFFIHVSCRDDGNTYLLELLCSANKVRKLLEQERPAAMFYDKINAYICKNYLYEQHLVYIVYGILAGLSDDAVKLIACRKNSRYIEELLFASLVGISAETLTSILNNKGNVRKKICEALPPISYTLKNETTNETFIVSNEGVMNDTGYSFSVKCADRVFELQY